MTKRKSSCGKTKRSKSLRRKSSKRIKKRSTYAKRGGAKRRKTGGKRKKIVYGTRRTRTGKKYTVHKKLPKGKRCSDMIAEKIAINMKEYKRGKFQSRKQAIAVAYAQVKKSYPSCRSTITKKRNKKRSR